MSENLKQLWQDLADWSQATFGKDSERGPVGALKHLKLEADEALLSGDLDEFADCLILVLDASRRRGMTLEELIDEAQAKLEICKTRTYPKPIGDEPSLHKNETTI